MKTEPKILARSGEYYAKEGATKSGDRIIYVCKDAEAHGGVTIKDESWDKVVTVVALAVLAAGLWWLVAGCHAHFHLKDVHTHYHGEAKPPAEIVIEIQTGDEQ